jgi:hypothetical protein
MRPAGLILDGHAYAILTLGDSIEEDIGMAKTSARSVCLAAAVVLLSHSPGLAQSLTCQVADPVGDFFPLGPCPEIRSAPYLDIVGARISTDGGQFLFEMTLAAAVPAMPPLDQGAKRLVWAWNLDTNPGTAPKGFPFDAGTVAPPEFIVRVIWDGTSFAAVVIDRRPLLSGSEAVIVPAHFEPGGSVLAAIVDASILGNPASFHQWTGATQLYVAQDGTSGFCVVDRTATTPCGP